MKFKNISITFIIVFATWLLLNGNTKLPTLSIGIIVSLAASIMMCTKCDIFSDMKLTPRSFAFMFVYFWVFTYELFKANLQMAKIVITPSLPINPGIVEVETKLKSRIGRLILANSITLTPGTLTVEVIENKMYIHQVVISQTDTEKNTESIVRTFEKYLEEIYG